VNDPLFKAIDRLVPEPDSDGDWHAVLALADARRADRTRVRSRTALAFVFVALAIGIPLLTTPAFGLLVDLIERTNVVFDNSKPAPNLVKKEFADLAVGAPPRFAPGILAAQAREVGTFKAGGKTHALWVVPTRRGGYCYTFEHLFGGCRVTTAERKRSLFGVTDTADATPGGKTPLVLRVGGDVTAPNAATIELLYADGSRSMVPFVWVSAPISAGFFIYDVHSEHRTANARATAAILLDADGNELARQTFRSERPRHFPPPVFTPHTPRVPRKLPATSSVPPSEPVQRSSAQGVSVVAGANGVVVFNGASTGDRTSKLSGSVSYVCFRLTHEFGIFDDRSVGFEGAVASTVTVRYHGVPRPFDGCEIQAEYGHTWPDRYGSHSAVELALTDAGRNYFADRAAARDLALFVRSRRMHQLRKETGDTLERDLEATYGSRLSNSRIRHELTASGVTFTEMSQTGKHFKVVIANGKIARQNLKPYAFVF
jgi:hypothetical protein